MKRILLSKFSLAYVFPLLRFKGVVQAYLSNGVDPASWIWDAWQSRWEDGSNNAINHNSPSNDRNIIADVTLDVSGRQTAIRDPRGNQTTYAYDMLNRRTGLTQPPNPTSQTWLTAYADLSGGQSRVTATNPLNHQTEQNFDRLGRVIGINYLNESPKNTPDVVFTYDISGNRTLMREFDGSTTIRRTEYSYDAARRLSQVGYDNDGNGTVDQAINYEYDRGGLRTQMTLPGNLTITYTYDQRGQLLGLTDWDNQSTQYAYDAAGRLVNMERPNGLCSTYSYDTASRLKKLHHASKDHVLGHFAYELDARGNRTKAIEVSPISTTSSTTIPSLDPMVEYYAGSWSVSGAFTRTFEAGAAMRLTFFGKQITLTLGMGNDHGICDIYVDNTFWQGIDTYNATSGDHPAIVINLADEGPHVLDIRNRADKNLSNTAQNGYQLRFKQAVVNNSYYGLYKIQYTYDALARITSAIYQQPSLGSTYVPDAFSYTYDVSGNILGKGVSGPDSGGSLIYYTYDAANRLSHVNGLPTTYDAAGRLINDTDMAYEWDRAGRLLNGGNIIYTYNGLGQRLTMRNGSTTQYLLDVQPGLVKVLAATNSLGTTRYIHGPTGIQAQEDNAGNWRLMLQDGLGSVRGSTESNLNLWWREDYGPYGESLYPYAYTRPLFRFTGEPTNSNDLVHLRARYYNPTLGVFPSLDPLEGSPLQPMSLNRYAYVQGNVVNRVDPSGMIYEYPQLGCKSPSQENQDGCNNGAIGVLTVAPPIFPSNYYNPYVIYKRGGYFDTDQVSVPWFSVQVKDITKIPITPDTQIFAYLDRGGLMGIGGSIRDCTSGNITELGSGSTSIAVIDSRLIYVQDKSGNSDLKNLNYWEFANFLRGAYLAHQGLRYIPPIAGNSTFSSSLQSSNASPVECATLGLIGVPGACNGVEKAVTVQAGVFTFGYTSGGEIIFGGGPESLGATLTLGDTSPGLYATYCFGMGILACFSMNLVDGSISVQPGYGAPGLSVYGVFNPEETLQQLSPSDCSPFVPCFPTAGDIIKDMFDDIVEEIPLVH